MQSRYMIKIKFITLSKEMIIIVRLEKTIREVYDENFS